MSLDYTENFGKIKMLLNYRRLKTIHRCNNFLKINKEDVAQHSYFTAILCMSIGDELNSKGFNVDMELLLRKALLHDTDEAITSDIPYNVKNFSMEFKQEINTVLSKLAECAYKDTGMMSKYNKICSEAKQGLEGEILDIADMLELSIYCFEEIRMGNMFMRGLFDKSIYLVENKRIFKESDLVKDFVKFLVWASEKEIAQLNAL